MRQTLLHRSCTRYSLLTALFLSLAFFTTNAQANEHRVTLSGNGIPLRSVFKAIKKQTGFAVMYNTTLTMINQDEKVTVHFTATPLDEVLAFIFRGKNLEWSYNDDVLLIRKKETPPPRVKKIVDSTVTPALLTGKVTDATGQPLIGATVQVKGSSQGTTTDEQGKFSLAKVGNGDVLLISSVGYETRELPVKGRSVLAQLNVLVSGLDETVVIAYGTTTQRLSTGNIASVKAKEIAMQPVSNPLLALQGRVPGLFIEQATGIPGSGVTVRIQGQNSLSAGSDPLYVIDGVPYASQMLDGISTIQGRTGAGGTAGNPLSYINPADIESIEVLKDADATSIYGSRAAAGAILITTKKGKAGKTKVDFNWQQGWAKVGNFVDLLNTQQYLEMRHEAKRNDNVAIGPTDYDINGTWDTTRYTDWQKVLIGGTAQYSDAQLSVSGGTASTTFLVNGGYHRETTVFPGGLHDQKASVHLNVSHSSPNQRLRLQVDGKYLTDNNQLTATDLTPIALQLAPNAPALYQPGGQLNWATNAAGASTWANPLAHLETTYRNRVHNLIGNAILRYRVLPGLDIKANLGYTYIIRNEALLYPLSASPPETRPSSTNSSRFGNDQLSTWLIEPQATYTRNIHKGKLEVLLGSTFQQNQSNQQQLNAVGFSSDLLLEDIRAATTVTAGNTIASVYKYNAIFGRLNYNWQNKYIINLNARRDGSSRFGANNLFNNFWSVGGAWLFYNESFIQKHLPFLSYGKLRASYGTSGNDQIGDYRFMSLYFSRSRAVPYQGVTGLFTTGFPNPYLQWEEIRKLQAGLETGFWADRVLFNLTYYRNRSANQLLFYALPVLTGHTDITSNFPATIQNSGWELTFNTINLQGLDFHWSSSINLTIPENRLLEYKNLAQSVDAPYYIIGEPFLISRRYPALGVDPATGIYIYTDRHGSPTSIPTYPEDATVIVNTAPKYYGGLQNSIRYRGFTLDFLIQFVKQEAQSNHFGDRPGAFYSDAFGSYGNQPVAVLERWQKNGDQRPVQRFSSTYPVEIALPYWSIFDSDAAFADASFLRLKNLSLSWQLPAAQLKKLHLQQARIFTQGQNLLTFTKYSGLDPESRSNTLPPLRVWTLGIQVTL